MSSVIALAALGFTVASFWWLQARRGTLRTYVPQVYAAAITPERRCRLRFPLTFYNDGAAAQAITDMRVVVVGDVEHALPMITFRRTLKPLSDDVDDFAHTFPVLGRQAVSRIVEFGSDEWAPPVASSIRVRLEVREGHSDSWSSLTEFPLVTPDEEKARAYLAHRCDPTDGRPAD